MTYNAQELVKITLDDIMNVANGIVRTKSESVLTGFRELDELTYGWRNGELIVIAGRPGMGKTAFLISMVKNIAIKNNHAVAIFNLEMSSVQLMSRFISSETGVSTNKMRSGNIEPHEWQHINEKTENLSEAPIFFDDTSSLSFFDLATESRRLKSQHDIKLIVIDFVQLMTLGNDCTGKNRKQEISIIYRYLKDLAKELNIPIVILSQLPKTVDTRVGYDYYNRPFLSDLEEAGLADVITYIYRPEYYGKSVWDDDSTPCIEQGELMIVKHPRATLDNIRLKFISHLALFSDLEANRNDHS